MTDITDILDTKFTIYTYTTESDEIGTIIINTKIDGVIKDNNLFEMVNPVSKTITLRELLEKGFVKLGSTDIMESLDITYPDKAFSNDKPIIKGKYLHGSRKDLISNRVDVDFICDPPSEEDTADYDLDF